jgi:hypothetical protein
MQFFIRLTLPTVRSGTLRCEITGCAAARYSARGRLEQLKCISLFAPWVTAQLLSEGYTLPSFIRTGALEFLPC